MIWDFRGYKDIKRYEEIVRGEDSDCECRERETDGQGQTILYMDMATYEEVVEAASICHVAGVDPGSGLGSRQDGTGGAGRRSGGGLRGRERLERRDRGRAAGTGGGQQSSVCVP